MSAHVRVTGPIVVAEFGKAAARHGYPASTLTDNGMVFTTRLSGGQRGAGTRNGFEHELRRRGVTQRNSRPNHPTTCGKVERFQQTLKLWLSARPPPKSVEALQGLLDEFRATYNEQRPHRSLPRRATPKSLYDSLPKAQPGDRTDTHDRVRSDRIDTYGVVTLRHKGKLHHIGIGRIHARKRVILLVQDLHIRVVDKHTGELLRELILNPNKDYQGTGKPPGPPPKRKKTAEPI